MKFPKSVWFIVCQELCERFNYCGLRTILVFYLTSVLNYSDDNSTMIYHSFIFLSYFMPLFGAILSDSYWGKFKTMIRLSIVYAVGNIILTGSSMASGLTLDIQKSIAIVGLVLIAIGTGGIKPCAYTFGGDQFQLPEQKDQLAKFFNRFLIAIYIGALVSTFLTPELRKSVQCFGRNSCFPLAFGMLSLLMILAIVIFILGKELYVKRKPENHVIFKTFGCIFYAVYKKLHFPATSGKDHWIEHASNKYSKNEVSDTKSALDVLYIFITYPVFWALYEQQGSRWTLQAMLMNGKINAIDWEIKPDQMQTIHPFFALLLILSFKSILYPFLAKFGIRRPLHKIILSNFMAALAFLFAAILQYIIFGESTVIPSNKGQFTVYNGFNCNVYIDTPQINSEIGPLDSANFIYTANSYEDIVNISLKFDHLCSLYTNINKLETNVTVSKEKSISYFLTPTVNQKAILRRIHHYDDFTKAKNGHPSLRIIISDDIKNNESFILDVTGKLTLKHYNMFTFADGNFKQVIFGNYELSHGGEVITENINILPTTIYTLMIRNNSHKMESKLYATDKGNYLHILWQTPQYVCMIIADVIFIATTIEFSFTEAPPRIKSFVSACYSLTQSIGNLMVVITSALSFQKQMHEYLFFSGLMLVDMLLLIYMSYNYKYKDFKQRINDDEGDKSDTRNENEIQLDVNK